MKKSTIQYTTAKGVVLNDKGEILLLRQADDRVTGYNQFHAPGGILEQDETLVECLAREVKEEANLDIEIGEILDVQEWTSIRGDTTLQFVGVFYLCKIVGGQMRLQASEVSEAQFVTVENVDTFDILEPTKSVVLAYLESQK